MLVNVLNICSDDELMSDTDDALEEGMCRKYVIMLFKYQYCAYTTPLEESSYLFD